VPTHAVPIVGQYGRHVLYPHVSPFAHCVVVVQYEPTGPPPASTQLTAPVVLFVTSQVWFAAHPHWGASPHALLGATVAHAGALLSTPASTAPELLPPELLPPELLPPELLPPELLLLAPESVSPELDPEPLSSSAAGGAGGGTFWLGGGGSVGCALSAIAGPRSGLSPFAHATNIADATITAGTTSAADARTGENRATVCNPMGQLLTCGPPSPARSEGAARI
jgi:hypothetical protein